MLQVMAEERGASFHVPDTGFLGDNGAMIAYTGRVMLEHGVTTPLASSHVNPSFRVDQVDVVWRSGETAPPIPVHKAGRTTAIGAEAVVTIGHA